jgi:hypothetical protein
VASSVANWPEYLVDMIPDMTGGVLVNFYTDAGGALAHQVQRSSSGLFIRYSTHYEYSTTPAVVAGDGAGGAYAALSGSALVMKRLSSTGTEVWDPLGLPVSISAGTQENPVLIPQSDGSVIALWEDGRNGNGGPDVYANRVDRFGYLGDPAPVITTVADIPGDQGGVIYVEWDRSYLDAFDLNAVWGYGVWRAPAGNPFVAAQGNTTAPQGDTNTAQGNTTAAQAPRAASDTPGVAAADFKARVQQAVDMGSSEELARQLVAQGWEQVSYVTAAYQTSYSAGVPTYADSSGATSGMLSVKVIANGVGGTIWWESDPANGYSVDNLAPAPPLVLSANRVGDDVQLEWSPSGENEVDLSDYVIYRGEAPGVIPEPLYYLTETPDTTLLDTGADPATAYYYVATARDVHDNESVPSNEAMVDGAPTGVGDTPALTALQVSSFPNPFTAATEIRVGLPERSDVTVAIFDVAGRRVFERELRGVGEGWHSVRFDGRGTGGGLLPSGVYFARVTAGIATQTHKLVISR